MLQVCQAMGYKVGFVFYCNKGVVLGGDYSQTRYCVCLCSKQTFWRRYICIIKATPQLRPLSKRTQTVLNKKVLLYQESSNTRVNIALLTQMNTICLNDLINYISLVCWISCFFLAKYISFLSVLYFLHLPAEQSTCIKYTYISVCKTRLVTIMQDI